MPEQVEGQPRRFADGLRTREAETPEQRQARVRDAVEHDRQRQAEWDRHDREVAEHGSDDR